MSQQLSCVGVDSLIVDPHFRWGLCPVGVCLPCALLVLRGLSHLLLVKVVAVVDMVLLSDHVHLMDWVSYLIVLYVRIEGIVDIVGWWECV